MSAPAPFEINAIKKYSSTANVTSYTPYLITILAFIMLTGPLALNASQTPKVPLRQSFDNFPLNIGPWQGHRDYIDNKTLQVLNADAYLDVEFMNSERNKINLWIAYYEDLSKGRGTHSPQMCLPGSGWQVLESTTLNVKPGVPVRYILAEKGGSRLAVYYWYLQSGRWLTADEEYASKFYTAFDGLVRRRSDVALIRLITPVDKDPDSAQGRLVSFMSLITPVLKEFIPN